VAFSQPHRQPQSIVAQPLTRIKSPLLYQLSHRVGDRTKFTCWSPETILPAQIKSPNQGVTTLRASQLAEPSMAHPLLPLTDARICATTDPTRRQLDMMLPSLNGVNAFGFTQVVDHRRGRSQRAGRLEVRLPDVTQVQLLVKPGEPMTYSGPVWTDGAWHFESFAVVARPLAFLTDGLTIVSIMECDVAD
jgi:hypothetical protein